MLGAANIFRQNDPYEQLIAQIIRIESLPQQRLRDQRAQQSRAKDVLGDMDSKISALHTLLEDFTKQVANPFAAKAVGGAEDAGFQVSAGASADLGTHTLHVQRLARADTRVSARYDNAANDLRAFFDGAGAQTFSIDVAHPTEADPAHRVAIDVTVDPAGTTNDEILGEIAAAIDTAMTDAVTAGTITAAEKAAGALVRETSDTARLSISSGRTGYANRLGFTDSAGGLLAALGVTNAAVVSGSGPEGGMITDVGTGELDSALNAVFDLDGLTHYRASNSVTDALDGVTLTLEAPAEAATEFTISADEEAVRTHVEEFVGKYNELLDHIKQQTHVDPEAETRGALAGDYVFTELRFGLRSEISRSVAGQPAEGPALLTDLGLEINEDGTLSLNDDTDLLAAIEDDAGAVQNLFAGPDGVATRLKTRLDRFLGIDGLLASREDVITDRIARLDDRIDVWDGRLARRQELLREQFARLQETVALLQGQQGLVNNFFYGGF